MVRKNISITKEQNETINKIYENKGLRHAETVRRALDYYLSDFFSEYYRPGNGQS